MTCPILIEGTRLHLRMDGLLQLCKIYHAKLNILYTQLCALIVENSMIGETNTELRTRMTVHRQQTRHQDLTIIRGNEHFHHCSGGHFKIYPLYQVNTEGHFLKKKPTLNDK